MDEPPCSSSDVVVLKEPAVPSDICRTLVILLCPVMVVGLWRAWPTSGHPPLPPARASINPNTAPWYELTTLPGIGPEGARAVVAYREGVAPTPGGPAKPVFLRPADLDAVPGIGPKTLADLAGEVHFGD